MKIKVRKLKDWTYGVYDVNSIALFTLDFPKAIGYFLIFTLFYLKCRGQNEKG